MRFRWFWTLILMLSALPAVAREDTPAALSPQEVSEGWIRLFDGETDFGWKPRDGGPWQVVEGTLQAGSGSTGTLATTTEFADFALHVECWMSGNAKGGIALRAPAEGAITAGNAYVIPVHNRARQGERWLIFDIRVEGDRLTVQANGRRVMDTRGLHPARGVIALQADGQGNTRFRNIRLRPLSLKSIFNGKDLTGWKEISGHNSVYTVTPEGWLNVKNGNGDLQTEAQWGDFALQLEIYSNGDHLNSGVFFRANPGKFWSGYESQIRNQWQGDDRTKPIDYGTGAIYNRQAVRKVVSSDREWFTMTVVAHGLHMATWINGYQVTDFTDMRPADETNARNGARTKPGVLSLQGHDPTTDLSFRNIRVVEFPAR